LFAKIRWVFLGGEQTYSVAPERQDQRFEWRIKGKAR
jgi:hypothetical protein